MMTAVAVIIAMLAVGAWVGSGGIEAPRRYRTTEEARPIAGTTEHLVRRPLRARRYPVRRVTTIAPPGKLVP